MGAYSTLDPAVAGAKYDDYDGMSRVESAEAYETINFGAPVFSYLGEEKKVSNLYYDTAKVVYSRDFETSNAIAFTVNGVSITPVNYSSSHAVTMGLLKTAVDALSGVDAWIDTSDTNSRTLWVRTKYTTMTASSSVTGGSNQATASISYQTDMVYRGIALFIQKYQTTYTNAAYFQYDSVSVLTNGLIWSNSTSAGDASATSYITTSGTYKGYFVNTAGLDVGCKYRTTPTGAGLAVVQTNGIYKPTAVASW